MRPLLLFVFLITLYVLLEKPAPTTATAERAINQINEFYPQDKKQPSWDKQLIEIDHARQFLNFQKQIVIAVIDTGIDFSHPLLKDKIWTNPGESGIDSFGRDKSSNGIDDDKNGYIDDTHGWNFVEHSAFPRDTHGHGTHVSGIIAQLAPEVKILPLKYFDENSSGETHMINTIKAIDYARSMGAEIINYSAGGLSSNLSEEQAIARAARDKVLFVAAAGNESANTDIIGYYPAGYELPNIIAVTAINSQTQVLDSSNYSSTVVDIAAPGEDIYSSLPGGGYGTLTGTSQATAFVSAIAALLMSHRPDLQNPEDVIQYLVQSGTWNKNLKTKTRQATRLNAYYALTMAGNILQTDNKDIYQPMAQQLDDLLDHFTEGRSAVINRAPSGGF